MGTSPVGFNDASLRTACGRRGIKRGMTNKAENSVFVASVHALVFEDFGCADAVRIAGLGLCGFHYLNRASIARRKPRGFPRGLPRKIQAMDSTKCFRPDPWAGMKTARWPPLEPAQARQSEQGVPTRSEAHRVSML